MRTFPLGWWSFDLGKYRPCDSTYQLYAADSLPPLDESLFKGRFDWLPAPAHTPKPPSKRVAALASSLSPPLSLPDSFVRFMSDGALQDEVPTCTACEWDLSDAPVTGRVHDGAYWTIRFLRDQQDCLFWYLVVGGVEDAKVLCSPIPFDDPKLDVSEDEVFTNSWIVSPTFESFVYRFWMENVLWDLVNGSGPRTPEQRRYLDHYMPN